MTLATTNRTPPAETRSRRAAANTHTTARRRLACALLAVPVQATAQGGAPVTGGDHGHL